MFSFLRRKGLREARLQFCLRLRQGRLSLRAPGRAAGPVPAGGVAPSLAAISKSADEKTEAVSAGLGAIVENLTKTAQE